MSSSRHWDVIFEEMADRFALYAMDLRGFGRSSYNTPIDSIADLAADIDPFADRVGLDTFHVVGWSAGGAVAMEYAATRTDRVRTLVLIAPASTRGYPIYRKDDQGQPTDELLTDREAVARDPVEVAPMVEAVENEDAEMVGRIWNQTIYVNDTPEPDRYERYIEALFNQRNLIDIDYALTQFNISDRHNGVREGNGHASQITADTLVVHGDDDVVVDETMIEETVSDLGGPTRLVSLSDCGHSPLIDAREQLLAEMEAFLAPE